MSASRQEMSSEEMEQIVAQRVANAIEAIAIYESKICMAHDSMNQVVREEATIGKNVSNKRKCGSDHDRDSDQQQSKRIEVVRAHATGAGNKKAYAGNLPYCNKSRKFRDSQLTGPEAVNEIAETNMPTSGQSLNVAAIEQLITQCVTEAMTAYEANQNNQNGDENPYVNAGGVVSIARECTYQDFVKCQPLNFKGNEGVDSALTWWNSHKRTIGNDAANEIQKMETELWNLAVRGNDLTTYTQRFQELILLCTKMVPEEEDRVEKFIGGLPDNIQGNITRGGLITI
ncbi:putative reverse transcriptase domain-containing protein [Tanacetum coccineum]